MLPDAILDKLILPSELVRTLIVALTNGMYMPKGLHRTVPGGNAHVN